MKDNKYLKAHNRLGGKTDKELKRIALAHANNHNRTETMDLQSEYINLRLKGHKFDFDEDAQEIGSLKHNDVYIATKYKNKAENAASRVIDFTLTFNEYKKLLSRKRCYYTGIAFDDSEKFRRTLDRIDNKKGYTKENTVPCCHIVNSIKNLLLENKTGEFYIGIDALKKMVAKL